MAGPDEYSNGVDDAVFTNAVAATALRNATRAADLLGHRPPTGWNRVADGLRIPYDADRKVFLQYAGYNGSTIKQADTVLLMYPLEWPMEPGAAAATLDYYAARTDPDGPAMTDSVHAIDAAAIGEPGCSTYTYLQRAVQPYLRGPYDLFSEARGDKSGAEDPLSGFPAEDFLTGKGGFLQVFTHGLTGLRLREDGVHLDPLLPPQLREGVRLTGLRYRDATYEVEIGARTSTARLDDPHSGGHEKDDNDRRHKNRDDNRIHASSLSTCSAVHGRSSRGYTTAVAPSISMTSTSAPTGITWVSSRARADHSSPDTLIRPWVAVTSCMTSARLPIKASLPSRVMGERSMARRAMGRTMTSPATAASASATS
ncbi:hypothetical protein SMICM304S_00730 [Streptomyces microflavus]